MVAQTQKLIIMKAYYYEIVEFNEVSQRKGDIISNGIITDSEATIYPAQNTGNNELPYECEAHHFRVKGYRLNGFYFDIPFEVLDSYRL